MVSKMDKLLPCPMCGGKAEFKREGRDGGYSGLNHVECSSCKLQSAVICDDYHVITQAKAMDMLADKWSTRVSSPGHAIVPRTPPTDVLWKIDEAKPETLRQAIEMYIEECGK